MNVCQISRQHHVLCFPSVLNHYFTHIVTVVADTNQSATWCLLCVYVCVCVLHTVWFLLSRYDDDHIAGGDKERYAR